MWALVVLGAGLTSVAGCAGRLPSPEKVLSSPKYAGRPWVVYLAQEGEGFFSDPELQSPTGYQGEFLGRYYVLERDGTSVRLGEAPPGAPLGQAPPSLSVGWVGEGACLLDAGAVEGVGGPQIVLVSPGDLISPPGWPPVRRETVRLFDRPLGQRVVARHPAEVGFFALFREDREGGAYLVGSSAVVPPTTTGYREGFGWAASSRAALVDLSRGRIGRAGSRVRVYRTGTSARDETAGDSGFVGGQPAKGPESRWLFLPATDRGSPAQAVEPRVLVQLWSGEATGARLVYVRTDRRDGLGKTDAVTVVGRRQLYRLSRRLGRLLAVGDGEDRDEQLRRRLAGFFVERQGEGAAADSVMAALRGETGIQLGDPEDLLWRGPEGVRALTGRELEALRRVLEGFVEEGSRRVNEPGAWYRFGEQEYALLPRPWEVGVGRWTPGMDHGSD